MTLWAKTKGAAPATPVYKQSSLWKVHRPALRAFTGEQRGHFPPQGPWDTQKGSKLTQLSGFHKTLLSWLVFRDATVKGTQLAS